MEKRRFVLLNIADIVKFVGSGVRCYEEGQSVFNANHVLYCGITKQTLNETHIFALCIKSSALKDKPYEINIVIQICNETEKRIESKCACPAGLSGRCKHCVAVLYVLQSISIEDLEEATCTDVKQQWGRLKSNAEAMYATVPVSKFYYPNKKSDSVVEKYDSLKNINFLEVLTRGLDVKNVELLKVKAGYRSSITNSVDVTENKERLKVVVQDILKRKIYAKPIEEFIIYENWTNNDLFTFSMLLEIQKTFYKDKVELKFNKAVNLCINTQYQNNDLWRSEHRIRITSSIAYVLYTYVSNPKPDWDMKITKLINGEFKGNTDTRYGQIAEKDAITVYKRQTDFEVVEVGLLVNPHLPWLGYSPDGIVPKKHILEIKCPKQGKHKTAFDTARGISYTCLDSKGDIVLREKHKYILLSSLAWHVCKWFGCMSLCYL